MEDNRCAADGENQLFVNNENKNTNNCRSVVKLDNIFKQQNASGNANDQELFPLEIDSNDTQVLDTVVSEAVNHEDVCLFEATGTVSHSTTIVASSSPYLENNDSFPRLSNDNISHLVNDVENVLNVGFIQDSNNTTMVDTTQYDFDNSEDFSNNSCRVIVETDQEKLDSQMNRQEDIDEIPKCDQGRNYNTSVNTIPESDLSCSVSNLNDVLKSENLISLACNSEQFIDLNISKQVDVSDEIFDISSLFDEICTKECISNDVLLSFHENGLLISKDKELCSLMEEIIDEDLLSVVFERASSNAGKKYEKDEDILTLGEDKVLEVDDNYGETSDQVLEFEGTESLLEENKSVDLKNLTSIFGKEDKISDISLLDPETHLKDNYNGEVDEKIFEIKSEKLLKEDEEKEKQMKGEGKREAALKPSLSTIIEEEEHNICYTPFLIEKTDIGLSSHGGDDEEENLNFERKFMIKGDEPLALRRLTPSIIEDRDDFRDILSVEMKGEDLLENKGDDKYLQYGGKQLLSSQEDGVDRLRRRFSSPIEDQDKIIDNPLIEKDLKYTNNGESNEGDLQIKSEKLRKNHRPDALRTPSSVFEDDDDDMSDISSQERKVGASRNDREKRRNYRGDGSVTSRTSSFYGHDDRVFLEYDDDVTSLTGTQVSDSESYIGMDEELKPIRGRSSGKLWTSKADVEDRWCHDLYVEEEQMPKTAQELIDIYGYDIRKEESCPEFKQRTRIVYNSGKRTSDTRGGGDRSRFDQRNGNNSFSSNSYKNTGKGERRENQRYAQQEAGNGFNPPNSYKIKKQLRNQESENQTRIHQREEGNFSSKNYKISQKLGSGDQPRSHQQEAGNSCSSPSNGYIERQFKKHLIDVEEERFEYYYPKDMKRREFKLEDSVMCLEANVSSTRINTSGNFERAGNSYVFSNSYNEQYITGEQESEDHKYQWKAGNNYTFPCDTYNARQYQEKKLTANNDYFEYCYPEYSQSQQGLKMGDATRKDPNVNLTSMVGLKNYFSRGSRINEHFVSPNKSESLRTEYERERKYDFEEHKYLYSSQYKTEMDTVSSTRKIHDKSSNQLLPTKTGLRIPDCNTHMRTPFSGNDSATMLGRSSNFVRTVSRNPVQRRPSSENDSTTMLDRFSNSVGTGPINPDHNTYLRRPSSENDSTTMPDRFSNFVRIGPKNTDRNTHLRRPFFKNERSVAEKFENVNMKKMEPSALSSKMIRNALNELDLNSYKKEAPKSPMVVTNQSRRYSTQRNRALPELKMMDEV